MLRMKMKVRKKGEKALFASKKEFIDAPSHSKGEVSPEEIWEFVKTLSKEEALLFIPPWLCAAKKRETGKTLFPVTVATIQKETVKAILIQEIEVAHLSSVNSSSQSTDHPVFDSVWVPKSQITIYQRW